MASEPTLKQAISDLKKISAFCNREGVDVPPLGIRYLRDNVETLEFYLTQLYTKTTAQERQELLKNHRELDYAVVSEDFREIAGLAIREAKSCSTSDEGVNPLLEISEDDIRMLIRALEYAKYCSLDTRVFDLKLSPIEQYGLKNYLEA